MSNVLNFKTNKKLMALRTSNSFGDQIVAVIDLTQPAGKRKDLDFPYCASKIVFRRVEVEGHWTEFTERNILKMMGPSK